MTSQLSKIVAATICGAALGFMVQAAGLPSTYDQGFQAGFRVGFDQALVPTVTNHQLEDVCLSMWVGKQARVQQ